MTFTINLQVIRDHKLFAIVGVLLLIDVLLLTTWQIKDPQRRKEVEGPEEVTISLY